MNKTPDRYIIRPLEKDDITVVSRWLEDLADLALFDRSARVPLGLEASQEAWVDAIGNEFSKGKYWFAVEDDGEQVAAIIGLENVNYINGDAVLSLCVNRSHRNKGLGIRATALVLDVAFHQLGLSRLTSYYRADNAISGYLTKHAGFKKEGCMRKAWFSNGQRIDMIVVGILHQEWTRRRKTLSAELDPGITVTFGRQSSSSWSWPPANAVAD